MGPPPVIVLFLSMVSAAIHFSNWKWPIDDLRDIFEHRSELARLNKETWKFAQRQYSKNGFYFQLIYIALMLGLIAVIRDLPWWWPQIACWLSVLGPGGIIWVNRKLTEQQLKAEFDETGRRRQLPATAEARKQD